MGRRGYPQNAGVPVVLVSTAITYRILKEIPKAHKDTACLLTEVEFNDAIIYMLALHTTPQMQIYEPFVIIWLIFLKANKLDTWWEIIIESVDTTSM